MAAATTTVAVGGKGTNPKTTLYVGGLEDSVNDSILHSTFIPFGDIKDVSVPLDHTTGKHRGFGFVEFEEKEDAAAAIDNMHNSELYGKVLRVNYAQPMKIKGGDKGWSHQPVWADADRYMEEALAEKGIEEMEKQARAREREEEEEGEGGKAGEGGEAGKGEEGGEEAGDGPVDPMKAIEDALVAEVGPGTASQGCGSLAD
eukprot:evm.model.scf_345.7 EVM.evm.TU.scf_345.7   scf_345:70572-72288(+)